jgi:hypothetical protein
MVHRRPESGQYNSNTNNWLRPEETNRRLSQSPAHPSSPSSPVTAAQQQQQQLAASSHEGSASPRPSGQLSLSLPPFPVALSLFIG